MAAEAAELPTSKAWIRIPRIRDGETARMTATAKSLCENLSDRGRGDPGKWLLRFAVAVPTLSQLVYSCRFAVENPWNPCQGF
jgi:hypothetical protein